MRIECIWEHNGDDTLLYAERFIGAYTRGASLEIAEAKMAREIASYCEWAGIDPPDVTEVAVVEDVSSELMISDADSDALFRSETASLTRDEYEVLKALVLKSASDLLRMYESITDKEMAPRVARTTFYGEVPRSPRQMYEHTKSVNSYYFGEIGVNADNEGNILECRKRGFEELERRSGFLQNEVFEGSYGERWSLRKLMRRFVWHDRIHARAMYRVARRAHDGGRVENTFCF